MSQENVDVVRRWITLVPGTPDEVAAAVEDFWDEDGDYYPVRKFPEARPCHSRDEIAQFLLQFAEAFHSFEWCIRRLIPVRDDRVLAWITLSGEGRGSGIDLGGDLYQCLWLRHGRLFRVEDHLTVAGALRALGFEGETLPSEVI